MAVDPLTLYNLPLYIIFGGLGIAVIWYAFWSKSHVTGKGNRYFVNEVLTGALMLVGTAAIPYFYASTDVSPEHLLLLVILQNVVLSVEMLVWSYILIGSYFNSKKNPERAAKFNPERFRQIIVGRYDGSFKKDVVRKALHVLPVLILFGAYFLSHTLATRGILADGLDPNALFLFLVTTVGYGFVEMFLIADLCRLRVFKSLPEWAYNWYSKSIIPDEMDTVVSSSPMVLAWVPFIFINVPVFFVVTTIGALADAAASIVGKGIGKHRLWHTEKKTVEGLIGGMSATLILSLTVLNYFQPGNLPLNLAMAVVAAFGFGFVDIFAGNLSDNIANPVVTGVAMLVTQWLLI
jgi:dolichol kinase